MKMQIVILGLAGAFLILNSPVLAIDRLVPSQYPTIQAAIDDCNDGDVVIAEPNIYTGPGNRDIDFKGLAITVRGTDPNDPAVVAATVIDCENSGRGLNFHSGENASSVLSGFTITNGSSGSSNFGGGIFCYESSPTISHCIITGNSANLNGGGIHCRYSSSPRISYCKITGNSAVDDGGGIYCFRYSNPLVNNCMITGNSAVNHRNPGKGGGIFCEFSSSPTITNCTITNNRANGDGGGIFYRHSGNVKITNSIIWGNTAASGSDISLQDDSYLTVSYSDVEKTSIEYNCTLTWGDGCINSNPEFISASAFHIGPNSPCINAGDPNYIAIHGEKDIDGEPRIIYGRIDIGADEVIDKPVIKISSPEFHFFAIEGGVNPELQILEIQNMGNVLLNWLITEDCSWLSVEPNSGSCLMGEINAATLSVDIANLTKGNYFCELVISDPCADNSPQIVEVDLVIQGPIIDLSVTEFQFQAFEGGSNSADQTLSISNVGGSTLNWEITEDCGWLTVEPDSGSCSMGESNEVTLSVDITDLTKGNYTYELVILDPYAENSPQIVDVNLVIMSPIIGLSVTEFQFHALEGGSNPADQILSISNVGGSTLNWEITADCGWLTVEPDSGSCYVGEVNEVAISVDIAGLASDAYTCNLTILDAYAEKSPRVVTVNLNMYPFEDALYVPSEYPTIQAAIDAAVDGNIIIVAPGTYTGNSNCDIDLQGKAITLKSLSGPENCIIDAQNAFNRRGFYFHSGEGPNSIISGFTIKRGSANGANAKGGGIHCSGSSPTIENCIITNNKAIFGRHAYGGGIYCVSNSNPVIIGCTISGNRAKGYEHNGGYAYGGGIYCTANSNPVITGCTISGNRAQGGRGGDERGIPPAPPGGGGNAYGGGIYCSSTAIENCVIVSNVADGGDGGDGIYMCGAPGGSAAAGGIYCGAGTSIENCTVVGNTATGGQGGEPAGGNGASGAGGIRAAATTTITDCIIWGNSSQVSGTPGISYSDVEGGYAGEGNINADPCFVTGPEGDYYLSQVAAGQAFDSPCVDAGSDTAANLGMDMYTTRTDETGDAGIVDMGYHYSMPNPADIDGDGDVDFFDYVWFAMSWPYGTSHQIPKGSVVVDGDLSDWPASVEWRELDKVYWGNPNDVSVARFALQWDDVIDKVYAAVVVNDTNHVFLDEYVYWNASDRIEVYSQGDAEGGTGWSGIYDVAQHYYVAPDTIGGSWTTWALGGTLGEDAGLEYAVGVDGAEIIYEVGVRMFDNYGNFSGGETLLTDLHAGHVVGFDIVVCTRWDTVNFGMLSENLMTGKFNDAGKFAKYMLVDEIFSIDLDGNGVIDYGDVRVLADNWLWKEQQ